MTAKSMKSIISVPISVSKTAKMKLTASPDNLASMMSKDQNKLIHLDPVPSFKDRHEIKPWLQKIFYPQGIDIVIERSDTSKVTFKCRSVRSNVGLNPKSKGNSSRSHACPFRIRAAYSVRLQKWNVVVMNNIHAHELRFDLITKTDDYKKFKENLRQKNDEKAIKTFDELEYKTSLNLPLVSPIISCDCGLTKEIEAFNNIFLPLSNPPLTSKKNLVKTNKNSVFKINSRHMDNSKHKPRLKKKLNPDLRTTGFLDNFRTQNSCVPMGNEESLMNLNEIDFTNMFCNDNPIQNSNTGMDFFPDLTPGPTSSFIFPSTPTEPFPPNKTALAASESTTSSPNFMETDVTNGDEIKLSKDTKSNAPTSDTDITTNLGKERNENFGILNYNYEALLHFNDEQFNELNSIDPALISKY
ncbi:Aft2p [Saccharomyces paradoxus]|uniref:Aft2p n=1 Tax=Saccharomyces paradoxus TaxID=27291 RepID=A0A8B8V0M5_SACPA|nr:Aft2 [Saccharomyces paradoxus]QHS76538.1 Aft2 [Saccharomyces paradoxus]